MSRTTEIGKWLDEMTTMTWNPYQAVILDGTTWSNMFKKPTPHVPERVIYNGVTTIAIFPDGKKVMSRPDKGAVFDKETGLAMCIAKHVYSTRAKFLKAVKKANDQNKEVTNDNPDK